MKWVTIENLHFLMIVTFWVGNADPAVPDKPPQAYKTLKTLDVILNQGFSCHKILNEDKSDLSIFHNKEFISFLIVLYQR